MVKMMAITEEFLQTTVAAWHSLLLKSLSDEHGIHQATIQTSANETPVHCYEAHEVSE
jgi:hypothetical protein